MEQYYDCKDFLVNWLVICDSLLLRDSDTIHGYNS